MIDVNILPETEIEFQIAEMRKAYVLFDAVADFDKIIVNQNRREYLREIFTVFIPIVKAKAPEVRAKINQTA